MEEAGHWHLISLKRIGRCTCTAFCSDGPKLRLTGGRHSLFFRMGFQQPNEVHRLYSRLFSRYFQRRKGIQHAALSARDALAATIGRKGPRYLSFHQRFERLTKCGARFVMTSSATHFCVAQPSETEAEPFRKRARNGTTPRR